MDLNGLSLLPPDTNKFDVAIKTAANGAILIPRNLILPTLPSIFEVSFHIVTTLRRPNSPDKRPPNNHFSPSIFKKPKILIQSLRDENRY